MIIDELSVSKSKFVTLTRTFIDYFIVVDVPSLCASYSVPSFYLPTESDKAKILCQCSEETGTTDSREILNRSKPAK
ncbi:hypothetical protein Syn7502_02384 [Synechococcus sp. PCC 7502]|nr:hypothetical protein Syn7502_02384 [Synechococcus sp. PCC 7502]